MSWRNKDMCIGLYTWRPTCRGSHRQHDTCSIFIKYSQDKTVRLLDRKLDFPRLEVSRRTPRCTKLSPVTVTEQESHGSLWRLLKYHASALRDLYPQPYALLLTLRQSLSVTQIVPELELFFLPSDWDLWATPPAQVYLINNQRDAIRVLQGKPTCVINHAWANRLCFTHIYCTYMHKCVYMTM